MTGSFGALRTVADRKGDQSMRLLLIDTDSEHSDRFAERLAKHGLSAKQARSPQHAIVDEMAEGAVVIVLDIGHGDDPALVQVQSIREAGLTQPIMVLSGRGDWREKVECLDAGADDYLVKPVRSEEVSARIRAIVRRMAGIPTNQIALGGIDLDLKARCGWLDGKCLNLTRNEFRLLCAFMLNPGQILSSSELLDRLNPVRAKPSLNALEVQIARLRRKIGPDFIRTARGLGYRFDPESDRADPLSPVPREQCHSGSTLKPANDLAHCKSDLYCELTDYRAVT